MLLLVGLGNPGPNNNNNRHNIGFRIIDAINQEFSLSKQKPKFKGLLTTGNIENKKVLLVDDLLATGGTANAAIKLLKKSGAKVQSFLCLIELSFLNGKQELDIPFKSLIRY